MKNKIDDLRNHLFETLEALKDKNKPMELDRARAIAEVAQTIVNSAKVEVEFIRATGSRGSDFIPDTKALPGAQSEAQPGRTVHRLRG